MSEFVDATELSVHTDGPNVAPDQDNISSSPAGIPPEALRTANADPTIERLHCALRLALRAADADVTCLVARDRIVLWASRKRSSAVTEGSAASLFTPEEQAELKPRAASVLARWMARSKTVRIPINKDHGVYLMASRRRSRNKFSRSDGLALQDAARLAIGELDGAFSRMVNSALTAAADSARLGVIIADQLGKVMFSNGAAQRFIAAGRGVRITDNRLMGRRSGEHSPLRDCLADMKDMGAVAVMADDGSVSPIVVKKLVLKGRKALAIFVDDPEYPTPPAEWLREVYKMTKREAEVSALLAGGLNVSEVAGQLGLSETTVKSYCKDVFAKLDVRRKPDLVRILAAGPLTLSAPLPPQIESGLSGALSETLAPAS
ncbi:MAG: helix-turn-helix transcriptional regulator [Pseudomonadota bacterium]